jgi:glucan phosphoethanolaminetransferase (alkaline phosphatase superfamily)
MKNILYGGLAVGVLDGLAAVISSALRGVGPTRVFQFVASGLLGRDSFRGGIKTVWLGVLLHFIIAFGVAAIYYLASRKLPILIQRAILCGLCGMIYGVMVYFAMQYLVLPFSAVTKGPFSLTGMLQGVIIHMFFVGLPAALVARRSAQENSI